MVEGVGVMNDKDLGGMWWSGRRKVENVYMRLLSSV
jgi:hypothetical protein